MPWFYVLPGRMWITPEGVDPTSTWRHVEPLVACAVEDSTDGYPRGRYHTSVQGMSSPTVDDMSGQGVVASRGCHLVLLHCMPPAWCVEVIYGGNRMTSHTMLLEVDSTMVEHLVRCTSSTPS